MRQERGFALVITLIVTALLVALVTEFIHETYVEVTLNKSFADAQQASLLADSGVAGARKLLQTVLAGQEYGSLLDKWAYPLEMQDERGTLRVEITDESAKLNLNSLVSANGELTDAYPVAVRLFSSLKLPTNLCDSVADWIDKDDDQRSLGAETPYYTSLPTPYQAKNASLETFEELSLVKGFDEKTRKILKPFVTVYGDVDVSGASRKVNVNTAPVEVLAALEGMTADLARRVVEYRKTTPIKSPSAVAGIPGLESAAIGLQGKITVKGSVYRIYARAQVNDTVRVVDALVRLGDGQSAILYWRES